MTLWSKSLQLYLIVLVFWTSSCSTTGRGGAVLNVLPPKAKKIEKRLIEHGDIRVDPYHWMRERENPEVLEYLKAENTYTKAKLQPVDELRDHLFKEMVSRIEKKDSSVPLRIDDYFYYTKYQEDSEYSILVRKRKSLESEEEVLLDANELAKGKEFFLLRTSKVSPNHRWLAFAVDTVGRNFFTIYIKDLVAGKILDINIENVTGNVVWAEDSQTLFFAQQHPETLRSEKIYSIDIHTGERKLIFYEKDEKFSTFISKTISRSYLIISSHSSESSESWLIDAKNPGQAPRLFSPRKAKMEYDIDHAGDFFLIRSNKGAKNFKLFRTLNEQETGEENWQTFIKHRPEVYITYFYAFKDYVAMGIRQNGLTEIEVFERATGQSYLIPQTDGSYTVYIDDNVDYNAKELRYSYSSLTTPLSIIDFDLKTKIKRVQKEKQVLGGFQKENYVSERVFATSVGGAQVPISLVYKKGVKRDGSAPLLLYGYGSYGENTDPSFSSLRLSLLDRGFIFAIAHVRGSSIMGESWYLDGKYLNKKNTFIDFIAAAEYLVAQKYSQKGRIYAEGASAGGLLMGAVINERPDLFHGVVAEVPFVDVLSTMLDDSIPLTTGEYEEWGNPHIKAYYDYMKSYSPYDNVGKKPYPHLLVTSGFYDSQVQYWEPAKWVAKLRELSTSENLILLDTNLKAGHSGKSGRFKALEDTARNYAFFIHLFESQREVL